MKAKVTFLFGFLWLWATASFCGEAPVVYAGSELYATTTPSSVYIPVTVDNFEDIGYFRLTLNYPSSQVTYQIASSNLAFPGISINGSTPGTIVITWTGSNGVSLPNQSSLVVLTFTFISGNAALTWETSGVNCQFKKYDGGSYSDLNDLPKTDHYKNGKICKSSPVITAPYIINAQNGTVSMPVTVSKYKDIVSGTLYLSYDTTILTLQSAQMNPLIGFGSVGSNASAGGSRKYIVFTWYTYTGGVNLNDGAVLCTLNFQFSSSNGTFSTLQWYDMGPSCKLYDSQMTSLNDIPAADFYKDGLIASAISPETTLPTIYEAPATPGVASVPVKVRNFSAITSFNLWYSYDPLAMTFSPGSYTANPSLGGSLTVSNITSSPDGKARIHMAWSGSPVTLADNSDLITFSFGLAPGSGSILKWNTGSDSCQYSMNGNVLWKNPVANYFKDGVIGNHLAPFILASSATAAAGQQVTVPVNVSHFSNITGFDLVVKYDPGVMNFQSSALVATLDGTFTANLVQPGKVTLVWRGSSSTLTDGSDLLNLVFSYMGGTTPVQWDVTSLANGFLSGGGSYLFDLPKSSFYQNGSVSLATLPFNARVKILLEGAYVSAGNMSTGLTPLLPLTQPFSGSPWNYNGTEQVGSLPSGITDWVLVELRSSPWPLSKVAMRAGFLKSDGSITDLDGTSDLHFTGIASGTYYVVIRHRNHLAVMSSTPVVVNTSATLYDFTSGSSMFYGGTSGCKKIDQTLSKWGMIAGDANQSSSIYIDDYTDFWMPQFGNTQYIPGDFNMDGSVFINDYTDYWLINFGRTSTCPQ